MNFIKHHAQHFTYSADLLTIDIFGGVEGSLTDGLFSTLKISLPDHSRPPVRHNLDLFNDNQITRLTTKICERFEVGHSVVSVALNDVVELLEEERMKVLQATEPVEELSLPISNQEQQAALKALKSPDLMERTFKAFEVIGICGEAFNAMILFLAMTSRKLPEPLSVICMAKTGAGKSYLVEKIASCMPSQQVHEYTQLTAASLYHHAKNELAGKVLLIEDLFGAKGALFPIRELQSKKRISKTMTIKDKTGDLKAMTFVVEGPLCVIACTSYDKVFIENANRCLLLSLDNSSQQDQRIMEYQKKLRAGLIDRSKALITQQKLQHIQCALEPVSIVNPYAPLIELPKETLNPRRTLPLVLDFIEAITFYHQYQREEVVNEKTGEVYLQTHPDDIKWAFKLLNDVIFRKSDELSASARDFYNWLIQSSDFKEAEFFPSKIRQQLKIHPRTLNRHLKELTDYGYLTITGGNRHTTGYSYKANIQTGELRLSSSVEVQLNEVLKKIEKAFQTAYKQQQSATSKPASKRPTQPPKKQ